MNRQPFTFAVADEPIPKQMKKSILSLFSTLALCLSIHAQGADTVGSAIENQPITFAFEHTTLYPTRLYIGATQVKEFSISELTASGTTNGVVTYKITLTGQPKGVYPFTVRSVAILSTGEVLSDPSNVCTVTVRPNAPGQFRKL